jgi:hypothetical protein
VEKEEYAHSRQSTVTSPLRTTTCTILWSSVKRPRKKKSNFLYLDSITVPTASYPNPLDWSKEHTSAGNTVVGSQRSSKLDGHSQTARIRSSHWGFQSTPCMEGKVFVQESNNTEHKTPWSVPTERNSTANSMLWKELPTRYHKLIKIHTSSQGLPTNWKKL